jgi:Prealbumin-like fold domain
METRWKSTTAFRTITLTEDQVPSSDPGSFDLKIEGKNWNREGTVLKAGAGDGDSGSIQVAPGSWTVLESAAAGTTLSDHTSSIACTRNGNPGPSGNGQSLQLTLAPNDVLVCTITNQRK